MPLISPLMPVHQTRLSAVCLHDRADELLTFDVIERTLAELCCTVVTVTSSNCVTDHVSNTGTSCLSKQMYIGRHRSSSLSSSAVTKSPGNSTPPLRGGGKYTGFENFAVIDFCLGNGMRSTRSYYGTLIAGPK